MFQGEKKLNIDSKGRLQIPVAFRKECLGAEGFMVKKSTFDKCVDLFLEEDWDLEARDVKERLSRLPSRKEASDLWREFNRGVHKVFFDGAGRIILPKELLKEVGITKTVYVVGHYDKISVYDAETYMQVKMPEDDYMSKMDKI